VRVVCDDTSRDPPDRRADFRGRDGAYYNFFSAPGFSVIVRTEDAAFTLHNGKLTARRSPPPLTSPAASHLTRGRVGG